MIYFFMKKYYYCPPKDEEKRVINQICMQGYGFQVIGYASFLIFLLVTDKKSVPTETMTEGTEGQHHLNACLQT